MLSTHPAKARGPCRLLWEFRRGRAGENHTEFAYLRSNLPSISNSFSSRSPKECTRLPTFVRVPPIYRCWFPRQPLSFSFPHCSSASPVHSSLRPLSRLSPVAPRPRPPLLPTMPRLHDDYVIYTTSELEGMLTPCALEVSVVFPLPSRAPSPS